MKKKIMAKATAMLLVTMLAATTAFSGCGKKDVDYDMGEGGTEEGGTGDGGELSSRLGVPESYDGEIEAGDSGLDKIKIEDDDIITPASDSMSIVSYKKNTFDNAYKQKVCEAIFDKSKGIYVYDWEHQTKEDLQGQIDTYQTMLEEAQAAGDSDTEEYCKEYISYLEEAMTTATDEREGAGDYSATEFIGSIGDNEFMISFYEESEGLGTNFELSYYPLEGLINYKPHEGATYVSAYDAQYGEEEMDDDTINQCTFSEEEAVSLAQDFLNSCGIDDVIVTSTSSLLWEYYDSAYNVVATEYDGYIVEFGRSVNGIAPYTADLSMVDTLSDDDIWYETLTETFTIQIDSNGVINASCYPLFTPTGEEEKNVELLSWKELLKALEKNIPEYYKENKTSYSNIEFNDVQLTYYSMKDESQEDVYKYVPVWIFAQADQYEGVYDYDYPVQAIMVNATDGTIYNLKDILTSNSYEDLSDYYDDYYDAVGDSDVNVIESDSDDSDTDSSDIDDSDVVDDSGADDANADDANANEDDFIEDMPVEAIEQ